MEVLPSSLRSSLNPPGPPEASIMPKWKKLLNSRVESSTIPVLKKHMCCCTIVFPSYLPSCHVAHISLVMPPPFVNPHQRCRYSGSPFARIHYFYTAGSRSELQGVDKVLPSRDIEAVIKLAASAASRNADSRSPGDSCRPWRPQAETSLVCSPRFLEFALPVGCASSRLDHGFQILPRKSGNSTNTNPNMDLTQEVRKPRQA